MPDLKLSLSCSVFLLLCIPAFAANQDDEKAVEKVTNDTQVLDKKVSEDTSNDALNEPSAKDKENGCKKETSSEVWVDRFRAGTHTRLCNTASWIDGLFGEDYQFRGQDFRGKISLGFREDEVDGLDPRLRVRIRTKLPNVSNRFNAFIGRVEEDSYISNTEVNEDRLNNVGLRSTNDDSSEWLVGLGYRNPSKDRNGWDFSVGAKISSGFSPYAKAAHHYLFETGDDRFWKTEQTLFWREQDGFGVSSNIDYTRLVGDNDIAVLHGSLKYTEEEEQWEWFSDATWHHTLSPKRGISSSVYMRGEEKNPVSIPEYGMTFTYIRPILREWLFMEVGVDLRWERESRLQRYKNAIRFGLQFEMLLGDYYRRNHRN